MQQPPAVDVEHLPGRPRGVVGQQKADRAGDVVGLAQPAERQQAASCSSCSPSQSARDMSVATSPGATALTRMPRGPSS